MNDIEIAYPEWIRKIEFDEYEKLAAVGYSPQKIAMFYKLPETEFLHFFHMEGSRLKFHYDCGIAYHQGIEIIETLEKSQAGNTMQGQRYDKMRKEIEFERLKQKIIYGTEE